MKTPQRRSDNSLANNVSQQNSFQPRPFAPQPAPESPQSFGQAPSFSFSEINVLRAPMDEASESPQKVLTAHSFAPPPIPPLSPRAEPNTLQRVIETRTEDFLENDDIFLDWQERFFAFGSVFEGFEINGYIEQIQQGTISDSFEIIRLKLEADYQPESVVSKLIEDLKAVSGTDKESPIKYYSHADPSIEIDKSNATITALMTGDNYGHTRIYIEFLDGGNPRTVCTDLIVETNSDTKEEKVIVNISEMQKDSNLKKYLSNPKKKTWKISQDQAVQAVQKAKTVQEQAKNDKYEYSTSGGRHLGNLFSGKKLVNCARYGVKILKAAGVDGASAGKVIRMPKTLVED